MSDVKDRALRQSCEECGMPLSAGDKACPVCGAAHAKRVELRAVFTETEACAVEPEKQESGGKKAAAMALELAVEVATAVAEALLG